MLPFNRPAYASITCEDSLRESDIGQLGTELMEFLIASVFLTETGSMAMSWQADVIYFSPRMFMWSRYVEERE